MTPDLNRITKTIFSVPMYLPYVNDPIDNEVIKNAEEKLGVKLPDEYIQLIRIQNGGYIRYELPEHSNSMIYGIGNCFTSILDDRFFDYGDDEFIKKFGKKMIPFDGDGHWYLCLDYRHGDVPSVSHLELEGDAGAYVISDSFMGYLKLLTPTVEENSFYITQEIIIEEFMIDLGRTMELDTNLEPDSFAHGYTYHRAIRENGQAKSWVFVKPNRVPLSFVRDDEYKYNPDRYDRLKKMYSGDANRLVDNDDVTWEVEFDGKLKVEILSVLNQLGISGRLSRKSA